MLHLPDWSLIDVPPHERVIQDLIGVKSSIYLPLLREDECIGVLALVGNRPNRFGPEGNRAGRVVPRPGADRDRERAAVQRDAGGAGAADGDRRRPEGDQPIRLGRDASLRDHSRMPASVCSGLEDGRRLSGRAATVVRRRRAARHADGGDWGEATSMPLAGSSTGLVDPRSAARSMSPISLKSPAFPKSSSAPCGKPAASSVLYAPMLCGGSRPSASIVVSREGRRSRFPTGNIGARAKLRRSGGDRDPERAPVQRDARRRWSSRRPRRKCWARSASRSRIRRRCSRRSSTRASGLFGSEEIGIYTIDDDEMVRVAAWRGPRAEEARRDVTPLAESVTGRVIRERRTHHIPDLGAVPICRRPCASGWTAMAARRSLYAPMLWEEQRARLDRLWSAGRRGRSRSGSRRCCKRFADQAAIAIQNARLFNEVNRTRDLEALQQQTATAEVLEGHQPIGVRSRLRGVDDPGGRRQTLPRPARDASPAGRRRLPARDAIRAARSVRARRRAKRPSRSAILCIRGGPRARARSRIFPTPGPIPTISTRRPAKLGGYRAIVVIPLMREDELVGIFSLGRPEPEPFTESQIKLVQTFADQAAIAIENARLFDEVQARTRDLERGAAAADRDRRRAEGHQPLGVRSATRCSTA